MLVKIGINNKKPQQQQKRIKVILKNNNNMLFTTVHNKWMVSIPGAGINSEIKKNIKLSIYLLSGTSPTIIHILYIHFEIHCD